MKLKFTSLQGLTMGLILCISAISALAQPSIQLRFLGRYSSNTYDAGGTEITAYDASTKRLFSVNASTGNVDIINLSNPSTPSLISSFSLAGYGSAANSVAAKNGIIAIAVEAVVKQDSGKVVFIDANGNFLNQVTVGALPDMLTFTPDGNYVLVANEGEPNATYTNDPEGSVAVINISGGVNSASVAFARFNTFTPAAIDSTIRIFGPGSSIAQDIEPEYITVSANSQTAWVTCQENNAWAIIDIPSATVTTLKSMGFKDHNLPGNGLDASDQNSGIVNIANWPIKGMYMPDAVASFVAGGQTYLVSANEGDVREYTALNEALRVGSSSYKLDTVVFPNYATLKNNNNLGRLNVTTKSGDYNGDGFFEEIFAFGSRSFSIWDANGNLVWDSGDQLEQITNSIQGANFNCSNTNNTKKNRSDDKGPEPEAATVATIGDSIYAFIGLERIGGIMVYNITTPGAPYFVQYINTRNFAQTPALNQGGDLGPEGLLFIPKSESPNGHDLLVVANEISGTISILEIGVRITIQNTTATCDTTGSALVSIFGGSGPYVVKWNADSVVTTQSSVAISNLPAGNTVVTVMDAFGQSDVDSVQINLTPAPDAPGPISGITQECTVAGPGARLYIIAPVNNATSYNWNWNGSNGVSFLSGNGTTNLSLNWTNAAIQAGVVGTLTVTPINQCGVAGPSQQVNLEFFAVAPVTPFSISGPSRVCPGDTVVYTFAATNRATGYQWTLPAGMNIVSGGNSNILQVAVVPGYTGGTLQVQATNICGISPARTKTLLQNIPARPVAISGQANGICNATGIIYNSAAITTSASLFWTSPVGTTIVSGQGTNTITLDVTNPSFIGGPLVVVAQNACGSSASRTLTLTAKPARPEPVSGTFTICPSATGVAYSVATVAGAASYNWNVPAGAVLVSGQGSKNIVVDFGPSFLSGQSISVNTSNACGSSINRTSAGIFTDPGACGGGTRMATSDGITLNVYPNPASDVLNVSIQSGEMQEVSIDIIDITGKTVFNQTQSIGKGNTMLQLPVSGMAEGLYFVRVRGEYVNESMRITVKH